MRRVNGGKMIEVRSVCVYCGSGDGDDPVFRESAERFGRRLAEAGVELVYGGGSVGLMGAVAKSAKAAGGRVVGIIPEFLTERERALRSVDELIVTPDMHSRKQAMFERSDAIVALPGGIGTLEELVEMMTWAQLGRHDKKIVLANVAGFWTPLCDLLDHMRRHHFIRAGLEVRYVVVDDVDDILPALRAAPSARPLRQAVAAPVERL